jgi:hypothetical protein
LRDAQHVLAANFHWRTTHRAVCKRDKFSAAGISWHPS